MGQIFVAFSEDLNFNTFGPGTKNGYSLLNFVFFYTISKRFGPAQKIRTKVKKYFWSKGGEEKPTYLG